MAPPAASKAMPNYTPSAQTALLKSANRVFDLDHAAESLDELTNGIALAHILHELDSEFDPSHLESIHGTSKYLTNKRNIQAVYKGLFRFIRRQVPELSCQAKKFDYHAVAENPDSQGISQLLAVMVSAAALGPDNGKYVPRIQHGLDRENQAEIMQIIRAMQQDVANYKDDDDLDEAIDAVMEARDIDLLVEEQNAALRQQLESTKKNLSDYITRLEYLQQSHEELKYEKEKNDRELEVLRKATQDGANSAEAIKLLEAQVHEQMEIITRNEETIRNHDRVKSHLEGEVQRLNQKSIQADELRDQVAEWRHKAEEFEKKANTAERYKQKLESQQHLAKEVQNLQYEKAELQEQLRSLVNDRERNDRTRKAEDELTKMITQSEQHLWDERNQKNQLIKDVATLEEELARLKAQRTHDERFIQDLQEQLQQGPDGATQASNMGTTTGAFNLEDELNNAADEDRQTNLPLQLSRFKAENELLRRTLGSTGDAALLRRELEEQRRQRDRLQQNYNDIFEKHTINQEQITALTNDSTDEGSQAFIALRTQLIGSQSELDATRKRAAELQTQISDTDRELLAAKARVSAAEKGGVEAIDELKSTDKLISESLKAELDRLREDYNFAVSERDAQKSQLIEALLAKDKLRKEVEDTKELQESSTAGPPDTDVSDAMKKSTEKIEKLRTRLKERKLQLEQSEQEKLDLQNRLKSAPGGESSAAQRVAADQLIKNLQRENALIATAWYDLTSRLQSNHVVLQRRPDAPRSWLNKQRQMVNGQLRQRDLLYLY
ncbi:microtubule binding protein HOOK3 [Pochonia chlamydosporia 170]|uniref:Microtubule binding protein HOOK3 n=1 Tax=Pochonia chlamydosporia 170 TaxID=1380566 RepID=A0A179G6D8_METCM|nr:microtubule binding protein HOOK3 [Pochonia chlamydosporia 170]OAQ73372.1 microtubule binding protein HOOK3 [Pochonia chlamydosporia 170]